MATTISLKTDGRKTWRTPQWLFDKLHNEFNFTVEICGDPDAPLLPRSIPGANALVESWGTGLYTRAFGNPPYGQKELALWVETAWKQARIHGGTVVLLLPARTDAGWFHDFVLPFAEVRFLRRRLRFEGARYNAPFPSMVVIFSGKRVNDDGI